MGDEIMFAPKGLAKGGTVTSLYSHVHNTPGVDQIKINTIMSPTASGVSLPGLHGAFDVSRTPRRYSFLHQMQFVN